MKKAASIRGSFLFLAITILYKKTPTTNQFATCKPPARPQLDLLCECYEDCTYSSKQFKSYGFKKFPSLLWQQLTYMKSWAFP
jgi:hypothetical protein